MLRLYSTSGFKTQRLINNIKKLDIKLLQIIQEMVIMELLLPFLEIQQLIQLGKKLSFKNTDTNYLQE